MAQASLLETRQGFGATARMDNWWVGPLGVFLGLTAFVVYATVRALAGNYFEIRENPQTFSGEAVAPYLSPFYSPLIFDQTSHHAWNRAAKPGWWPGFLGFSSAILILGGPVLFRLTCYYYRKAYYRAFWLDPPACAVGEPRKSYWGERYWPLLIQNIHRYTLYIATFFLIFLWWDAIQAFWWPPLDKWGDFDPRADWGFGIGLGTLIMLANVVLLTGFTFGCNSMRHLVGGRLNCFSCPARNGHGEHTLKPGFYLWRIVTRFNEHHALWAWMSLISVGFTDFYIMMCSMGVWKDPVVRFF
jgi:hypothetical protein